MRQEEKISKIAQAIEHFYAQDDLSKDLVETILYSVHAGGKRIRPLIFLDLLEGFGLELTASHFDVAASVEMIHTGSLIHDDLPAMDNDDYRRGRLTSHKKFGEDMAILAGDSLFLDPYAFLAQTDLSDSIKLSLIRELSLASGTFGMVAGQVLDMQGEGKQLTLADLQKIHANKTGKLLTFPFVAAGLVAEVGQESLALLRQAGELLGLAFQVRDDILDVTASFEELGKTPNKDLVAEKSTYPALLGLEESKQFLEKTLDQTSQVLADLQEKTNVTSEEIEKIIERLRLNG